MGELQQVTNLFDMTTNCKVTELFCIIDEFCKHFDAENAGNLLEDNSGVKRRRRAASLSDSEIMTDLCLNSTEIHDANSKAISEMAYVPPYRPDIAVIPIALVDSTHFVGDIVKAFSPASFLNPSNSMGLKLGLYNSSHIPRNSMVLRFLIQFPIMPLGSSPFFCLAIWFFCNLVEEDMF